MDAHGNDHHHHQDYKKDEDESNQVEDEDHDDDDDDDKDENNVHEDNEENNENANSNYRRSESSISPPAAGLEREPERELGPEPNPIFLTHLRDFATHCLVEISVCSRDDFELLNAEALAAEI